MSTDLRPIVILGAGGHARVLLELLRETETPVRGFVAPSPDGSRLGEVPWLGGDEVLAELGDVELVNGIGSAGAVGRRAAVHAAATDAGLTFRTLVHSRAYVDPTAELGAGAQVLAGAVVGVLARIGVNALINTAAVVDHDAVVGAHSHVASGAVLAGDVRIGGASHIGMGARVLQNVTIGASCVVGAGSVVLEDVADGTVVVGVPARTIGPGRSGDEVRRTRHPV